MVCFNILVDDIFDLQIIEKDINPYVDEWEKAKSFPAHQLFKKLGEGGFLGVTKPVGMFDYIIIVLVITLLLLPLLRLLYDY